MLAYYRRGERPVPRTVGLAMLGRNVYVALGANALSTATRMPALSGD